MRNKLTTELKGKIVDEYTRCVHYHSPLDIVAIKFRCCGDYYPCYYCHAEETDHETRVWQKNEFDTKAILCGLCNNEMTIHEYLAGNNHCPSCNASFNPDCNKHYRFYFEV